MSYYKICPDCGANLDRGERCDCKRKVAPGFGEPKGDKEDRLATSVSSSMITKNWEDIKI